MIKKVVSFESEQIGLNQRDSVIQRANVVILTGLEAIGSIYDQWLALSQQSGSDELMQLPHYYQSYMAVLLPDTNRFHLAAFYIDEELAAVLPFRISTKSKFGIRIRILEFPKTPIPIRAYSLSTKLSLETLISIMKRNPNIPAEFQWDILKLNGVLEDCIDSGYRESSGNSYYLRTISKNKYIEVGHEPYSRSSLSANMRSNLNRSDKKLAKVGDLEYATISQFPELTMAYEEFLNTEASGWKSRSGGKRAIKLHRDQTEFYRHLMESFASRSQCDIHLLKVDGKVIAADYCLREGQAAYSLKHGYDEEYSFGKPGHLLREYTIQYYSELPGIDRLDLISGYDWQDVWKPQNRSVFSITAYSNGVLAHLLRAYDNIRTTLKLQ